VVWDKRGFKLRDMADQRQERSRKVRDDHESAVNVRISPLQDDGTARTKKVRSPKERNYHLFEIKRCCKRVRVGTRGKREVIVHEVGNHSIEKC